MKRQIYYFALLLVVVLIGNIFLTGCEQEIPETTEITEIKVSELPPSVKPILYYPFDDGSGTVVTDASGNGRHGTLMGSATWNKEGRVGGALLLPGDGGYVRLPNNIVKDMRSMTIALWVKLADNPLWSRVFDFGGPKGFMYLTLNAGNPADNIRFSIYAGNTQTEPVLVHPSSSVALNTWTHIAVTVSLTQYCLYINGQKVATLPTTHFPMDIGADELDANYLGKSQFPADPYFKGLMDEFCIFNRALSEKEIAVLYELGSPDKLS